MVIIHLIKQLINRVFRSSGHIGDHPKQSRKSSQVKQNQSKKITFSELGLCESLEQLLNQNQFTKPTQVQTLSIPPALLGKNIFCSSQTGSGKTLSFLLPMINQLIQKKIDQALIICPTREIAIQIQKVLRLFPHDLIHDALVIGGTNIESQKEALRQYPNVLIATPGRLVDMLSTGLIWLNQTNYVVLDEADRMLDMGFEEDLNAIQAELSGSQQTLLFSATMFPRIRKIANRYATDYTEIKIGNPRRIAGTVDHVLLQVHSEKKLSELTYIISRNRGKVIVFFNSIKETDRINSLLRRRFRNRVDCIHSKCDQSIRERLIKDFRTGEFNVLLATDVAARGIDVPKVDLVINYDLPFNSEEYIHRVGRTGRAGRSGRAISFVSHRDKQQLQGIEKLIKSKIRFKKNARDLFK